MKSIKSYFFVGLIVGLIVGIFIGIGGTFIFGTFLVSRQMVSKAYGAAFNAQHAIVRDGIQFYMVEKLVETDENPYLGKLDDQEDGPCNSCFSKVLSRPLSNQYWTKNHNTYTYSRGKFSQSFTYYPESGELQIEHSP